MATNDLTAPGILNDKLLQVTGATTYTNTADLWDRYLRNLGLVNGAVLDRMLIHATARGITLQELMAGDLASTTLYDEIMADAPVLYWRNGESSGVTMVDEITTDGAYVGAVILGNAAIYTGGPTCATGFAFGTIYGRSPENPGPLTNMTLVTVVRYNSLVGVQPCGVSRHVSGSDKFQWRANGTDMEFVKIVGGVVTVTQPSVFVAGQTAIVAFTVDAAGNYVMYKNGVPIKSGALAAADYGGVGADWQIGSCSGMGAAMDGSTCENAVFNTVLTPERIAAHAAAADLL